MAKHEQCGQEQHDARGLWNALCRSGALIKATVLEGRDQIQTREIQITDPVTGLPG